MIKIKNYKYIYNNESTFNAFILLVIFGKYFYLVVLNN